MSGDGVALWSASHLDLPWPWWRRVLSWVYRRLPWNAYAVKIEPFTTARADMDLSEKAFEDFGRRIEIDYYVWHDVADLCALDRHLIVRPMREGEA